MYCNLFIQVEFCYLSEFNLYRKGYFYEFPLLAKVSEKKMKFEMYSTQPKIAIVSPNSRRELKQGRRYTETFLY